MKVVFVVGPTASGKSDFALKFAEATDAHILNADSVQFYQGLDIGSAKPSLSERSRVPHHLYDVAPLGTVLTAGDFRRMALDKLHELSNLTETVLVVGGSGFYIQALEKGMFDFGKVSPEVSAEVKLEAETQLPRLADELMEIDPAYARKVGPNDKYRIARAMELWRFFGKTPSQLRKEFEPQPFPFPILKVGMTMEKEALLARVKVRTLAMLKAGWVEETQQAESLAGSNWPPLQSVGYAEILKFLSGHLTQESLVPEIVMNTMRLAKRQKTWFRRDSEIAWYDLGSGFDRPFQELQGRLRL